jgi:hypothetical protein
MPLSVKNEEKDFFNYVFRLSNGLNIGFQIDF